MKSYKKIFLFFLLVLLLNCIISPWLAFLWDLILSANPEWHSYRQPFSRIFSRLYMILGIVLFVCFRSRLGIKSLSELGLGRVPHRLRAVGLGFTLAIASFAVIMGAMILAGLFEPSFRLSLSVSLSRAFGGLMTGLTVGFLEEIFFRGIIFRGLMEDTKPFTAFVAANFFYAAIHFVRPAEKVPLSGIEPFAGIKLLIVSFSPFLDPVEIFPGLLGLFLIGIVLSYAFLRTGSLYLSIGLHAGWIFGLKTLGIFGGYSTRQLGWFFGASKPKFVSGVATWIGVLAVLAIIHWITRRRSSNG